MSTVLGIIGQTLPPLANKKHLKHARNSLVASLDQCVKGRDITYALVTMDRDTGPWICNYLRKQGIPYISVEARDQPFTNKLRYWRNQAVDRLVIFADDAHNLKQLYGFAEIHLNSVQKTQAPYRFQAERRLKYLARNWWVMDKSDIIFQCALPGDLDHSIREILQIQLLQLAKTGDKEVDIWAHKHVSQLLHNSHKQRKEIRRKASARKTKKKYKQPWKQQPKIEVISKTPSFEDVTPKSSPFDEDDIPF